MKTLKNTILLSIAMLAFTYSNAKPPKQNFIKPNSAIRGAGNFKSVSTSGGIVTVHCGWRIWETCWEIGHNSNGDPVLELGNGSVLDLLPAPYNGSSEGSYSSESTSLGTDGILRPMYKSPDIDCTGAPTNPCYYSVWKFTLN